MPKLNPLLTIRLINVISPGEAMIYRRSSTPRILSPRGRWRVRSVEVEHVPLAQLTIHQLPLFVKPALGCVMPALKYNVVALKSTCEIIPSSSNKCVFPLEILDDMIGCSLCIY